MVYEHTHPGFVLNANTCPKQYQVLTEVCNLNAAHCIHVLGDNFSHRGLFLQELDPLNRFIGDEVPGCKG